MFTYIFECFENNSCLFETHSNVYVTRFFFVRVHDLSAGASRSIYNLVVIEFLHVCVGELTAKEIESIAHLNIIYL